MKKTAIILLSFFFISVTHAQKVDFGLQGGLNLATLHISNATNINSRAGLNLGFFFRINASPLWAIQPGLIYSMEGARALNSGSSDKTIYRLNFINIPVLLQYKLNRGIRLEGGAQMGFLTNAKEKTGDTTVIRNNLNSTSLSIPLGISYVGKQSIGFDARYVFGLTNLNARNNGPIIQSNVFQLGIIYMVHYPHDNH
jgi:Outer membrane protein beta-barrel domain